MCTHHRQSVRTAYTKYTVCQSAGGLLSSFFNVCLACCPRFLAFAYGVQSVCALKVGTTAVLQMSYPISPSPTGIVKHHNSLVRVEP